MLLTGFMQQQKSSDIKRILKSGNRFLDKMRDMLRAVIKFLNSVKTVKNDQNT